MVISRYKYDNYLLHESEVKLRMSVNVVQILSNVKTTVVNVKLM